MFWKQQIKALEERILQKKQEIETTQAQGHALFGHGKLNAVRFPNYFGNFLTTNQQDTQAFLA